MICYKNVNFHREICYSNTQKQYFYVHQCYSCNTLRNCFEILLLYLMYLHLSCVSVKHKISFCIISTSLNMSSECLLRDLLFNNAIVSVSLLAFGNDNGDSKHSLHKCSYSFLALLFTLMAFLLYFPISCIIPILDISPIATYI